MLMPFAAFDVFHTPYYFAAAAAITFSLLLPLISLMPLSSDVFHSFDAATLFRPLLFRALISLPLLFFYFATMRYMSFYRLLFAADITATCYASRSLRHY